MKPFYQTNFGKNSELENCLENSTKKDLSSETTDPKSLNLYEKFTPNLRLNSLKRDIFTLIGWIVGESVSLTTVQAFHNSSGEYLQYPLEVANIRLALFSTSIESGESGESESCTKNRDINLLRQYKQYITQRTLYLFSVKLCYEGPRF